MPFYSVENVTKDDFVNTKFITQEEHEQLIKRCQPKKGDILMTRIGSLGQTKLIDWDVDASMYVSLVLLRPNGSLETDYIYAYSKSHLFQREVIKKSLLNANPRKINLGDVSTIQILYPENARGRDKIVEILSDCDAAIEKTLERVEKLSLERDCIMFSIFSPKESPLEIRNFQLDELATIKKGEQLNRTELAENGKYPVYSGGIEPSGYFNSHNMPANTLTISEGGNSCGFVRFIKVPFWSGGHCYSVIPNIKGMDSYFLFFALKAQQREIMKLRVGSGLPNIQQSDLARLIVNLPKREYQGKVISLCSDIESRIESAKKQVELLRKQKRGLMQHLLTGKVRIK